MLSRVNFELPKAVEVSERKPLVARAAASINQAVDSRVAAAAEALDRTNIVSARLAVVNAAILALLPLLYRSDDYGNHWNVDLTRRIRIPTPWGASGWRKGDDLAKRWGLVQPEARRLGKVLQARQRNEPGSAMFILYKRGWYVAEGYATYEAALQYWQRKPVKRREWDNVE